MKRKKTNKKQILLSVTALLVILLLSAGITYSWIEGGTTYTIQTANDGDVKTGEKPDTIYTDLTINPEGTTSIDLKKFDNNTTEEGLYFSPASSADGENFYFPTSYDTEGKPTAYRKSNTNDIGTKFINYDFDVSVSKKCYLAFDGKPTFTLTKNGTTLDDSFASAFRIMIKSGDDTKILTTADSSVTSTAVTDENGTETELTAESVNNYLYNVNHTNKLFEYAGAVSSENIEVSVWLDGEVADEFDDTLVGSDVEVKLNLIAVQEKFKVSFDAVTYNNSGNLVSDTTFTGGQIKVDTTTYLQPFTNEYNDGDSFTATAIANTDYIFGGWYSDESCSTRVTENEVMTSVVSENAQYFAKFTEKPKYTVNAEVITTPDDASGGTVTVNGSSTGSATDYQDSTVTLKATANTDYRFDGWYTDAECETPLNSSTYTNTTQTVTIGSANATYYAKFVKQCTINFVAMTNGEESGKGGNVKINTDTAGASVSKKVDSGTLVTLTATPSTNAVCNGIYNADGTQVTALASHSFNADESVTYYAYFEMTTTTTTIYFKERSGFSKYNAYVYNKSDESILYSSDWPGSATTYDSETGYYKFEFDTTDTGSFRVIVNDGTNQYPASNVAGLEGVIGGTYLFGDSTLTEFDPDDVITESTTTIYIAQRSGFTTYSVWAYSDYSNYSGGTWPGSAATYDSTTGYYKYTFKTTDTGSFRVIISNNGNSQYPSSDGLTGTIGGTYFFASGSPTTLTEYNPDETVTITFTDGTSNSWIDDANAQIYLCDTSGGTEYLMTSSATNTWTATVPATVTGIKFSRRDPDSGGEWNSWSAGSRGTKTTYKATGDGSGSWQ